MHVVEMPEIHEAEGRMSLLDRLGHCEQSLGRYHSAESAYRKVLERNESILGKEHPDTLASMNNVAVTLNDQGKHSDAEKMKKEVLEKRKRILGDEQPRCRAGRSRKAGRINCDVEKRILEDNCAPWQSPPTFKGYLRQSHTTLARTICGIIPSNSPRL
ncbi:hypothetical protein K458DRAFT_383343 [Lentithecium fluviatile CBS 122367]|uniref:Kinesin light chain n=1 Tax=Lentithecium fluviatile CBS 122367 TaxID=1168545 RepID=A0A6G1JJ85_9PLEO|nr:hypothetical protein K458DRAFT_383343 [Lentithecium fluviatile CBS 122367]